MRGAHDKPTNNKMKVGCILALVHRSRLIRAGEEINKSVMSFELFDFTHRIMGDADSCQLLLIQSETQAIQYQASE